MPILTVIHSATTQSNPAIAHALAELTTEILRKKPELISVAIQTIAPDQWFIHEKNLADQRKNSFFLEIRITDESNTAAEKSRYISAVFQAMAGILGDLHQESYIHVHDVRATAYGYGGVTQQYRAVAAELLP